VAGSVDSVLADAGFGAGLESAAERLRDATVRIRCNRTSAGAGVVWSNDGLIVTNAHVAMERTGEVRLADGRTTTGEVVASDPWRDLAALRVPLATPPPPVRGDDTMRAGDLVLAFGHPLGWDNAVSIGVLHATERIGGLGPPRWLRADVRLMPGNSGGPLADADGRLIGLNALVSRGLAFAVPTEAVDALLDADRPMLGVALRPAAVGRRGRRMFGMLVVDVTADSAAARSGVRTGDVIRSVDGLAIAAPSDIGQLMYAARAADHVALGVVREGRRIDVDVEVGRGPPGARAA
jgi:serine protease Do